MPQTLQAQTIDLGYLVDRFQLQFVDDARFFEEWQENLPEISELDERLLDRVRSGFLNLLNYPPLLEGVVRMAVLDPLLFIAGFYLAPFHARSEPSIELAVADRDTIVKGKIDTLVLKNSLWIVVIESKKAAFSVEEGLAQILAYILASPDRDRPLFGLITTGGSFLFVKLAAGNPPRYGTSRLFGTRNPGDLYEVLRVLRGGLKRFDCRKNRVDFHGAIRVSAIVGKRENQYFSHYRDF